MTRTDMPEIPRLKRRRRTSDSEHNLNQNDENTPPKKPWEVPDVSERVQKSVLIKMPEPLKIKLDYVLDNSPGRQSMQKFILELISTAVEKKLIELGNK